ncbi:secreted RxLR effector protein 78-like [Beta vulgaris subsp. vulgaris]|uniref:secreted RxLR effector protein 78-like n=1 Tax=Beta vulgaris subsp. vulgaris TaxID=3555 RepID=UPI0020368CEF|nr:secreted RxLR effector protein 78-like [Beta vulgaris subsp. vulgaris]
MINEVIDLAQAGCMPGRNISDNILLATELIKGYNTKHISPRCMMKVDLKKAYDSIEWPFLQMMMNKLGFPSRFINWVMACVSSVSFSILINGAPCKPFKAKKGLRQGDPMSPFLFAIGMEYLSRCLGSLKHNPDFNFHPRCERLHITHLMFADYLLMFARADASSL